MECVEFNRLEKQAAMYHGDATDTAFMTERQKLHFVVQYHTHHDKRKRLLCQKDELRR